MDPAKKAELREVNIQESDAAKATQKSQRDILKQDMARSFITDPLLSRVLKAVKEDHAPDTKFDIIISLNESFLGGVTAASREVAKRADAWGHIKYRELPPYVFACLTAQQILDLASEARELTRAHGRSGSVVYRIWEDQDISTTLTRSLITVKADAAHRAFEAFGEGIVWAVLDSGIQGDHPHFKETQPHFRDEELMRPLLHLDFTPNARQDDTSAGPQHHDPSALQDNFGHGTHVAGIIAGCWKSNNPNGHYVIGTEVHDEMSDKGIPQRADLLKCISGVAPKTRLISLKVIADQDLENPKQVAGQGKVSWVLMAIDQIQRWNQYGKHLLIHGANLSLGYEFNPRWFACGKSPLCVEVDRLVRSGVVVVVSAGNGGYSLHAQSNGQWQAGYNNLSITDPGNADLAITVGSTHREKPHLYGVSYFSSRGPTGDGRLKPDLIAPGERIISCAAGQEQKKYSMTDANGKPLDEVLYCELSGTSMAAPHVSGAVAAFLSVRQEYIGEPAQVKQILIDNAIDMRRERSFQGAGLLDLMKVLQSV